MSRASVRDLLFSSTGKLAATYLVIIMVMSIGFSVVFYNTSTQQFNRPLPPSQFIVGSPFGAPNNREEIQNFIQQRFAETRDALLLRLIWLNLLALGLGGLFSYALARWSLRPIEESVEQQNQFVTDASHELRTPLTALQTTNEVALRKKKLKPDEVTSLLKHNISEAKKLRDLSNSLLELLKNDEIEVKKSDLHLQDVVAEAMSKVVDQAQEKDIVFDDQTPNITIRSNSDLLAQVLVILFDNAIKYSDAGKKVIFTAKKEDKRVMISVKDEGIGIKASELPYIFRRFYRADKSRTSNNNGGYGLGLAIAHKIVQRLGGELSAQSEVGSGSVFYISIPVRP